MRRSCRCARLVFRVMGARTGEPTAIILGTGLVNQAASDAMFRRPVCLRAKVMHLVVVAFRNWVAVRAPHPDRSHPEPHAMAHPFSGTRAAATSLP